MLVVVASSRFGDMRSGLAVAVAGPISIADPLGAIWSAAMLLGHRAAAKDIVDAIASVLATTDVRTRDLGAPRPRPSSPTR